MEPDIIINSKRLNTAQAMTVRVALEAYYHDLVPFDALGDDEHGISMRNAYRARIEEIRNFYIFGS